MDAYADPAQRLTIEKSFFNNLLLLGFNVQLYTQKYKLQFNSSMFNKPNQKGMEVVVHFLLNLLFPTRFSEMVKFIWPINDQINAKQFKQISIDLINELKTTISELPPPSSTIQSCSGKRFYELVFALSQRALTLALNRADPGVHIIQPSHESKTITKINEAIRAGQAHVVHQSRRLVQHASREVNVRQRWQTVDAEIKAEHDALTQELAAINADLAKFEGSPQPTDEELAAQLARVRASWTDVDELSTEIEKDRGVVNSILSGNPFPFQLNAKELKLESAPPELFSARPLMTADALGAQSVSLPALLAAGTAALTRLRDLLPAPVPAANASTSSGPAPGTALNVVLAAPRLEESARFHAQQLTAAQTFSSTLSTQLVNLQRELQETTSFRNQVNEAQSSASFTPRLMSLAPLNMFPGSDSPEVNSNRAAFATPVRSDSRAGREDVLEKLAKSVRRAAKRNEDTFESFTGKLLLEQSPIRTTRRETTKSVLFDMAPSTGMKTTAKKPIRGYPSSARQPSMPMATPAVRLFQDNRNDFTPHSTSRHQRYAAPETGIKTSYKPSRHVPTTSSRYGMASVAEHPRGGAMDNFSSTSTTRSTSSYPLEDEDIFSARKTRPANSAMRKQSAGQQPRFGVPETQAQTDWNGRKGDRARALDHLTDSIVDYMSTMTTRDPQNSTQQTQTKQTNNAHKTQQTNEKRKPAPKKMMWEDDDDDDAGNSEVHVVPHSHDRIVGQRRIPDAA